MCPRCSVPPLIRTVSTAAEQRAPARGLLMQIASPESVARAISDGVENEEEHISPTPRPLHWRISGRKGTVKALERPSYATLPRRVAQD
jgi:hypothetical protein